MGRVAEILILVNIVGGCATWAARFYRSRRRESNLEHVRRLERENAEIDRINERIAAGDLVVYPQDSDAYDHTPGGRRPPPGVS